MSNKINGILLVDASTKTDHFQTKGQAIEYGGHKYQLLEGKEKIHWGKRFIYGITALALTLLTVFIGLAFKPLRELWKKALMGTKTVQVYKIIPPVLSERKAKPSVDLKKDQEGIDFKKERAEIENIAKIMEENEVQNNPDEIYTKENLDQILNFVDKTKEKLDGEKQFNKFLKKLGTRFTKEQIEKIEGIPDFFPADVYQKKHLLSDELIDLLYNKVDNYFYNRKVFEELEKEVQDKYGDKNSLTEIYSTLGKQDYLMGIKRLEGDFKVKVFNAMQEQVSKKEFSELLEKIKEAAKGGEILDDDYLSKKFKVADALRSLSPEEQEKRRANLRKVINEAYLQRELKENLTWIRGSKQEITILKGLGYKINDEADYYKKEKIYSTLEEIIKSQLCAENYETSSKTFQNSFKNYALQARLKLVNMTSELQFSKFNSCLNAYVNMGKDMNEAQSKIEMEYPENFARNIVLGKKYLESIFNSSKKYLIDTELRKVFSDNKKEIKKRFQDDAIDLKSYEETLASLSNDYSMPNFIKLCENLRKSKVLEPFAHFYQKWAPNIKTELIQGFENSNEIFHKGVCWANACRLQMLSQNKPDLPADEFAPHVKILPVDRFRQSFYGSQLKAFNVEMNQNQNQNNANEIAKKLHTIPAKILKKEGFKEDKIFFKIDYDSAEKIFENYIKNKAQDLQKSEGWLRLGIFMLDSGNDHGHAINVRFDAARNRVWLTDSNVGLVCFEKPGQSFEQSREQCFEFFKDLITAHYKNTYNIVAYQVVK